MAYTFNQINSMISQGQDQNQQSIFGQGGADAGQQQTQAGGGAQGGVTRTSSQGEAVSSGAGASGSSQKAPQPKTPEGGQDILKKNKDVDTSFASNLVGQVKGAQGQLQSEADQYVQAQRGKAQRTLGKEEIDEAVAGDASATSRVSNLLRGPSATADEFKSSVGNRFSDIDQLASQGGLQDYLTRRGNENYTPGQAALDSLLISRDKDYQNSVRQANVERARLQQKQQEMEGGKLRGDVQGYLDQKANEAKTSAANMLKARQDAIRNELQVRANYQNSLRDYLRSGHQQEDYTAKAKGAYDELLGRYQNDPELLNFIKGYGLQGAKNYFGANREAVDPSKFYRVNENLSAEQVAKDYEANQFNRILELLGQGGKTLSAGNINPDSAFDSAAYQQAIIDNAMAARNAWKSSPTYNSGGVPIMDSNYIPIYSDLKTGAGDVGKAGSNVASVATGKKKIF